MFKKHLKYIRGDFILTLRIKSKTKKTATIQIIRTQLIPLHTRLPLYTLFEIAIMLIAPQPQPFHCGDLIKTTAISRSHVTQTVHSDNNLISTQPNLRRSNTFQMCGLGQPTKSNSYRSQFHIQTTARIKCELAKMRLHPHPDSIDGDAAQLIAFDISHMSSIYHTHHTQHTSDSTWGLGRSPGLV